MLFRLFIFFYFPFVYLKKDGLSCIKLFLYNCIFFHFYLIYCGFSFISLDVLFGL